MDKIGGEYYPTIEFIEYVASYDLVADDWEEVIDYESNGVDWSKVNPVMSPDEYSYEDDFVDYNNYEDYEY